MGELVTRGAGRPREYGPRTDMQVRFPVDLHARLREAAAEREVSINWLVNKAVIDFLERLIPVDEMVWTRPAGGAVSSTTPEPGE